MAALNLLGAFLGEAQMGSGLYLHMVMPPSTSSERTAVPCPHLSRKIGVGQRSRQEWRSNPCSFHRHRRLDLGPLPRVKEAGLKGIWQGRREVSLPLSGLRSGVRGLGLAQQCSGGREMPLGGTCSSLDWEGTELRAGQRGALKPPFTLYPRGQRR